MAFLRILFLKGRMNRFGEASSNYLLENARLQLGIALYEPFELLVGHSSDVVPKRLYARPGFLVEEGLFRARLSGYTTALFRRADVEKAGLKEGNVCIGYRYISTGEQHGYCPSQPLYVQYPERAL